MALGKLAVLLHDLRGCGGAELYMAAAYGRFLKHYGRQHYDDAGIWVRRIAECFCLSMLPPEYHDRLLGGPEGLVSALDDRMTWATSYEIMCQKFNPQVCGLASELGVCAISSTVWDDLILMAQYGNNAAHAHKVLVRDGMQADEGVFAAVIRITLLFVYFVQLPTSRVSRL